MIKITMPLSFPYVVRDGVHGNIPFTALEKAVIDHPLFQRLRSIRQLGFLQLVFPSATHTRFEHSLGVMHLTGRLFASAVSNQKRLLGRHGEKGPLAGTSAVLRELDDPRVLQVLRLAALVHDLGHGPFSHASETLTLDSTSPRWQDKTLPVWLRDFFKRRLGAGAEASHEWYSCLMAVGLFADLPPAGRAMLRDTLALLHPDIGLGSGSVFKRPQTALLLHGLLSSEMDGDRMDYLLRDSRAAGVSYGLYDLDRLTSALCFVQGPALALHESGLHAFEDYLISRYQMYLQVYTHRTNTAFEEMLALLCQGLSLTYPAEPAAFLTFTDATFPDLIRRHVARLPEPQRQVKTRLARDLFDERRPWKVAYQATAFDHLSKGQAHYQQLLKKLAKNALGPHICGYASQRTLSKLAPSAADAPPSPPRPPKQKKGSMPLLRVGPTRETLEVKPLEEVSYVLDGFRKPIALWRIYARPDHLAAVRRVTAQQRP